MMARHLLAVPIVLALSLLATAASSDVCNVCATICYPGSNNTLNCVDKCYITSCGESGTKSYKMAAMLKVKEGGDCVAEDKTSKLSVPGKVKGQYCVLKQPLH
jgi:hypothetical protein